MVDYIESFKSSITDLSGYFAEVNEFVTSLSGQLEVLKENTSGQYAYSVVSGGFIP